MDNQSKTNPGLKRKMNLLLDLILYFCDLLIDAFIEHVKIIKRNFGLFLGMALFMIGLFGFESGKYCDGNSADYLSCTRPSTFYFYDPLHIAFLVAGAVLVAVWFLRRRSNV